MSAHTSTAAQPGIISPMALPTRSWITPAAVLAVVTRPALWLVALRQATRMAPNRWWARWPFLPLPDASYMHFRIVTAYGGDGTSPIRPEDLLTYLQWCRRWPY